MAVTPSTTAWQKLLYELQHDSNSSNYCTMIVTSVSTTAWQ